MHDTNLSYTFFLFQVVLISLSGVMAPGPVTAVTIAKGARSPHAGAFIALGHGIVEFPLIFALMAGAGIFFSMPGIKSIIGLAGGIILLFMSAGMFKSINADPALQAQSSRPPFLEGIFLSAGNPYFLIWWATVGMTLINGASVFSIYGILVFAAVHWLCDLIWLYILSSVSFHGGKVLGGRLIKAVFIICGVMLAVFGFRFIADAAIILRKLSI